MSDIEKSFVIFLKVVSLDGSRSEALEAKRYVVVVVV